MTNWRDLPAGSELNRIIAERLGYRIINLGRSPDGVQIKTIATWIILAPGDTLDPKNPSDYEILRMYFYPDSWHFETESDAAQRLRDFSGDLNEAITLWTDDKQWTLSNDEDGNIDASVYTRDLGINVDEVVESGDTPALAICRAWLSWKDTQ